MQTPMASGPSASRFDEASDIFQLRQSLAVASSSWQDAEVARQLAQQKAAAAKQALQNVEKQPKITIGMVSNSLNGR